MRLIHCADLHLDSKMTANLDKERAKERKAELLHTFEKMIAYGVEHGVEAILIAGDMFDTKNISAGAKNVVKNAIVSHPEILFFYLKGNHDMDNFLSGMEELPKNLYLFNEGWGSYVLGKNNNIVITGVELNNENSGSIYNALVLDAAKYNIVMLHGQESENGAKDKAEVIKLRELKNKGIDYLALGHIHSYKEETLDARGVYCYSGCLEGRGFDECGEHGFVLLEIDEETLRCTREFVPFSRRNLYTVEVDVTDCMSSTEMKERIKQELLVKNYRRDSLIKIVLTGKVDVESELDLAYLVKSFEADYYFVKVYNETGLKVNVQQFLLDQSLKGEFVRTVMGEDMDEEERAAIIRYGLQVIEKGKVTECD